MIDDHVMHPDDMTTPVTPVPPTLPSPPVKGKMELKVRAATVGTYLAALVACVALSVFSTDWIHALPDWLETIVYPLAIALVTALSGYLTTNRPEYLSPSTVEAVRVWLGARMARR